MNGHKIVKRELDIHVKATSDKEDSVNYALEIDFEGIFSEDSPKQTMVVYDLLDLHVRKKSESKEAFANLIKHPVISTFILSKWKKTKWHFYTTSAIFMIFLLFYSIFIIHLFNRPEVYCNKLEKFLSENSLKELRGTVFFPDDVSGTPKENKDCERHHAKLSKKFLSEWDNYFSICEAFFLVFLIFLVVMEIYQAYKLKMQYFKELENYIEWVVLISALITMIKKEVLLQNNPEASIVRGVAGIGICAAWLELIFIIGRYPFRGGDFSIMFYNIIKKIARYAIAMFLMIIGFAFAFMVVNYGSNQDSFENPFKSFMMTLTMALGEFNFEDMYNTFQEDTTSRGFAMVLLVLLILFGTITMVNLFIAVIITDIQQLREDVFIQNLINMAQCSILAEELLPSIILDKMIVEDKLVICMHNLCTKECTGITLAPNLKPVIEQLETIARENAAGQC